MSYIKRRIEKGRTESPEYRAAYDEEVVLAEQERVRREALMAAVAAVRKAAHVTQHELAEAMQISQARVSQLENGEETLSVDRLLEMLSVLHGHIAVLSADDVEKYGLSSKVVGGEAGKGSPMFVAEARKGLRVSRQRPHEKKSKAEAESQKKSGF